MTPLNALELIAAILAAFRLTRFITADDIISAWRDRLKEWAYLDEDAYRGVMNRRGDIARWRTLARGKFADLLTCSWCAGFWISGLVYGALVLTTGRWAPFPILVHIVWWWAVAGGQSLFSVVETRTR